MHRLLLSCLFLFLCAAKPVYAMDETQLAVWANEAIIATYTYDYKNFMVRQKAIAPYFNAQGWINYSAALNASGLPATVQQNKYSVSAVATLPPVITTLGTDRWQAVMPILVLYQNNQQQKQNLQVTITYGSAPDGQGVRGMAIYSLQSTVISAPCECVPGEPITPNATPSPTNATPVKKP